MSRRNPPQPEPSLPPSEPASSAAAELPPELAQLENEAQLVDRGLVDAPAAEPGHAEPAAPTVKTADLLEGLLAPLAAILPSVHHGFAAMPLKAAEVKMLATSWAGVLDHYFPGGVNAWGPWGAALLATAAVAGPRLMVPPPKAEPAPSAAP